MSFITIGDMAQVLVQRRRSAAMTQSIGRLTEELSTGLVADKVQHLRGDTRALASVEHALLISGATGPTDPVLGSAAAGSFDMAARLQVANAAQAGSPDVARQVAAQMAERAVTIPGSYEITLSPEELGRVRIVLTAGDTGVSVSITGDRTETLDLLRRHIDHLSQDLRNLGFGDPEFAFGDQERDHGAQPALPGMDAETSDTVQADKAPSQAAGSVHAAEGLDLRL